MGAFFDYRDPLFGIIIFLCLLLLVFCINYYFEYLKINKENRQLENINDTFNLNNNFLNLDIALNSFDLPFDTLMFIATSYYKTGDYEKAISLLLALLKNSIKKDEKEQILDLLGQIYFKAGFLQKAKDIFLQSLEIYPRNISILQKVLIIYELLKDYKNALEILIPLEELDVNISNTKIYLETLLIIEHPTMTIECKVDKLNTILKENDFVLRIILEYFRTYSINDFWKQINDKNAKIFLDIFAQLEPQQFDIKKISSIQILQEFFSIYKSFHFTNSSEIFELNILLKLKDIDDSIGRLSFEYICDNCKNVYPLHQNRCPNCANILALKSNPILLDNNTTNKCSTF
jgi:tetratricopeptide (TPR) repeat protein